MRNRGFSLVELLVAIGIAGLILVAVYASVNMAQRSSSSMEKKVIAQQDARGALDLMALEIRMASYNQSLDNTIWKTSACAALPPVPPGIITNAPYTYKGIQQATPDAITVEMDIFETSRVPPLVPAPQPFGQNSNEIITYKYDAANLRITRNTNCGGDVSFLGDTAASGHRVVRVINGNADVNVPLFRYFNFNNLEITAGQLPASIPFIRTIEITIVVETENIDPTINARKRLVYSTRVIPRNHGANP